MLLQEYNNLEKFEVLNESEGGEKTYRLRGVFSRANEKNKNGRIYTREIMEAAVEAAQEAVKAGRFVGELDHPCLIRNDFDVLAKEGWKSFNEIKEGEEVASFNKDNIIEYKPVEEIINEPFKGKAYAFRGRNINSEFTGAHRHYLEDRYGNVVVATTKEIFENRSKFNKHKIIKTGSWVGEEKDFIKIGKIEAPTKEFMAFMGFYLAEGFSSDKPNLVDLSQNEGTIADEFREVLKNLPFEYKEYSTKRRDNVHVVFQIRNKDLYEYLKPLGNCYEKYIPFELKQLSSLFLEELLEWFIKGDGRNHRGMYGGNRVNVFSTSKRLIEDLHELVIKTGGSGNWTEVNDTEDYMFSDHLIEAKNKSTLYQLNLSTTKGIYLDERFLQIEEIEHDGNIYCLTVKDNENFYMKQDGKSFLTGNSTPKINIEKISHKITELRITPDGAVIGEMVPAGPDKYKFIALLEDGIGVGVSTRGVGNVKPVRTMGEEILQVQPGYRMNAIDIVHDPSAGTYPEAVYESYEYDEKSKLFAVSSNFKEVFDDVFSKRLK